MAANLVRGICLIDYEPARGKSEKRFEEREEKEKRPKPLSKDAQHVVVSARDEALCIGAPVHARHRLLVVAQCAQLIPLLHNICAGCVKSEGREKR